MVGNGKERLGGQMKAREWSGMVTKARAGYGMAGERRGGKDTVTFLMESTAVNVRSVVCSKGHAIRER